MPILLPLIGLGWLGAQTGGLGAGAGRAASAVHTESGWVSGTAAALAGVEVYRGIPSYAAAPVGEMRWKPPAAPLKWNGVQAADRYSANCMQTEYAAGVIFRSGAASHISEDCLYLNIWTPTPAPAQRLPVMVWIHGGALTRGAGSELIYDGSRFAQRGVVLVTINYRLGVFGFFSDPELTAESAHHASGDYGFLDQIAALRWVRNNIGGFGGDPNRVTVFGESAGSWSVNALMASPLAKGLFQHAIGESGGNFTPLATLAEAEKADPERLAAGLHEAHVTLAQLRELSAKQLLALQDSDSLQNRAVVDGWVLPDQVASIFAAGRQNDVPLLIGSNANEGTAFTPPNITAPAFAAIAKARFGERAGAYLKMYPASSNRQAHEAFADAFRDEFFGWQMRSWARAQAKSGHAPVYYYYFAEVPPGPLGKRLGAFHGSEIEYMFQHLPAALAQPADREVSEAMANYWINFAASGDPNRPTAAAVPWPAYNLADEKVMEFGSPIAMAPVPHAAALDLLGQLIGHNGALLAAVPSTATGHP